jgi:pimeloyl-ACP methyl ester carboxylesterase
MALPPCVLLPGLDGSGRLFAPLLAEPGLPFDPHVIPLPSDVPRGYDELVVWLEDQLPGKPFVLLAESFSGPLAIRFALRNPARVSHLILAATFLRSPLAPWLAPASQLAGSLLFARPPPAIAVRALLAGWDAPASLVEAIRAAMAILPAEVAAARARAALAADERLAYAQVRAPTLWIRSGQDHLLRAGHVDDARALRPDTLVTSVPGPHAILQRRPRECLADIRRFLSEGSVRRCRSWRGACRTGARWRRPR